MKPPKYNDGKLILLHDRVKFAAAGHEVSSTVKVIRHVKEELDARVECKNYQGYPLRPGDLTFLKRGD